MANPPMTATGYWSSAEEHAGKGPEQRAVGDVRVQCGLGRQEKHRNGRQRAPEEPREGCDEVRVEADEAGRERVFGARPHGDAERRKPKNHATTAMASRATRVAAILFSEIGTPAI